MRLNQAYVLTNPDRTSSALPSASVGEDENVKQFYEQSTPTQQLQLGRQCERNDETYDYIN